MTIEQVYQAETGKWYALVEDDSAHYDLKFDHQPTEQDIADLLSILKDAE